MVMCTCNRGGFVWEQVGISGGDEAEEEPLQAEKIPSAYSKINVPDRKIG